MTNPYLDPRWLTVGWQSWMLSCEAAWVVWLRMGRLSVPGAPAMAEAERMVSEKLEAAWQLQWRAMTGQLGSTQPAIASQGVNLYRRKVAANRRRLTGP
jgi:hypothetical protein